MSKIKRLGGFTRIDKLCAGIVLLLIALVISGLPSHPLKNSTRCSLSCSLEGDQVPVRAIERIAQKRFVKWAKEPVVIETLRQANSRPGRTIDKIIRMDNEWAETNVDTEWISELLNNPCAEYLKQLQSRKNFEKGMYCEIFVMDDQGCITAASKKTSDYWQGDEDKFVKSFADGKGMIFIDDSDYDESTDTALIQVSVPVIDPNTEEAIGVMTIGLNVKAFIEES